MSNLIRSSYFLAEAVCSGGSDAQLASGQGTAMQLSGVDETLEFFLRVLKSQLPQAMGGTELCHDDTGLAASAPANQPVLGPQSDKFRIGF